MVVDDVVVVVVVVVVDVVVVRPLPMLLLDVVWDMYGERLVSKPMDWKWIHI